MSAKNLIVGLAAGYLTLPAASFAQTPSAFRPGVEVATAPVPVLAAVGDLNGDGHLDVVVTNFYPNTTASVLVGNGDGTFQPHQESFVGYVPYGLNIADVNEDGIPDLVTTARDENQVAVLIGNGDGTFQPRMTYPTGAAPVSVIAGDFNHDGHVDLATSNLLSASVAILVGNGDGTFQYPSQYATDSYPYSVTQGDFNDDGNVDLATSNYLGDTISVLLGNGDATFQAQVTYAASSHLISIVTGDVNGDGFLDLAVVESSNVISVLLGNGDGTFQPAGSYPVGASPSFMSAADLDGDGVLDLIVPNYDSNSVSVLAGAGDGSFSARTDYAVGAGPGSATVGDLNGDGALDLVASNGNGNSITVLLAKTPQTITFGTLADTTFGDAPFMVDATASSGLAVTLSAEPSAHCTLDGDTVTIVGAGTCTVTAQQPGDATYRAAPDVVRSFTIAKATASIALSDLTHTYDGEPHAATATTTPAGLGIIAIAYDGAPDPPYTAGSHAVVATLANPNYEAAEATATLIITPATITVTANSVSKVYSAPVPGLDATLTGFVAGENASVVSGTAACTTTATASSPVGTYPITCTQGTLAAANYSFGFVQGVLTVTAAPTATSLTSNHNPSTTGQSVRFTATVTSEVGTPTGSVTFYDGATPLGTDALNNGGVATLTTSALTGGSHDVTAVYSGSATLQTSTSAALAQLVLWVTTTQVNTSVNPAVFGQQVTFTATLTSAGGIPDGDVTFKAGNNTLGTVVASGGTAQLTVSTLSTANHNIKAVYGGSTTFASSTSAALSQTVNKAPAAVTIGSEANPTVFGQTMTLSATVAAVSPGAGLATGSVTFTDTTSSTTLGTKTLNGGTAVLTVSSLPVGPHVIVATYNGSGNFLTSVSSQLSQTVNAAGSTTTLVSSRSPANVGQLVKFTATVAAAPPGTGKPTGDVRFLDGGVLLGAVPLNKGKAAFSTSALSAGSHNIVAIYDGSPDYENSASDALIQQVN